MLLPPTRLSAIQRLSEVGGYSMVARARLSIINLGQRRSALLMFAGVSSKLERRSGWTKIGYRGGTLCLEGSLIRQVRNYVKTERGKAELGE
ncbi:MAG: hypothetical protein NNA23_01950 [Nitrospira sp.]|nr:hypothetical protein [Nitrospira sp.]MCP9464143.1 hypothetical protein [Nitrospira sp.]